MAKARAALVYVRKQGKLKLAKPAKGYSDHPMCDGTRSES